MAALDLVKDLIAFDTTSRDSNLALIDYAQALLEKAGARCRRTYDATRHRRPICSPPSAPEGDGGYVLSGHTDVVPVDGQDWSSPIPSSRKCADGKLYGRGACDMKGFVGVALALAPEIAQGEAEAADPFRLVL